MAALFSAILGASWPLLALFAAYSIRHDIRRAFKAWRALRAEIREIEQ